MSDSWIGLLGSVVVGLISFFGVVWTSRENNKATLEQLKAHSEASDAKLEKAQAITDTKLENLTAEVRKHNNFAEKIPVLEEKVKVANKRIDDLERHTA
jgi:hypothetical protein